MTTLERAKVPLAVLGWTLLVVPVVYLVFSALYGQFTDSVPYAGNYIEVASVVLGGALLAFGWKRFAGALSATIAAGLLTLTGLVVLIVVAARAGDSPYTGVVFYVNGSLFVLTGGVATVALALIAARWSSAQAATAPGPGQYGWAPYGQQPYPQQGYPQSGQFPQQQPYPQQSYPQQGYPQSGPQPLQPGYPQQQQQGSSPEPSTPPQQQYPQQQYPQQPGQQGQSYPGQW